jgi:hypothetical protein
VAFVCCARCVVSTGEWLLFAVNHRRDRDSVDVFEVREAPNSKAGVTLRYQYSVTHQLLRNVNDVVIADPSGRSFYATVCGVL